MKKFFICLICSLTACSLFAETVRLHAVENDDYVITENSKSSSATYVTENNVEISVMADGIGDDEIKFGVQIVNNSEEPFEFNENSISTYHGLIEKENWKKMVYYPASKYYSNKESVIKAATAFVAIGAGILLLDLIFSGSRHERNEVHVEKGHHSRPSDPKDRPHHDNPPRRPRPEHHHHHHSRSYSSVHITYNSDALASTMESSGNDLSSLRNNLLYSVTVQPGETVNGIFYVSKEKGPDYRIDFDLPENDGVSFIFTRSDKEKVLHPFRDDDEAHFGVLFNMGIPEMQRYGVTFMYAGAPVGMYVSASGQHQWGLERICIGEIDRGVYYPDFMDSGFKNYTFDKNGIVKKDIAEVALGLDFKVLPHTWLMVGCGLDLVQNYYQGTETAISKADDETKYSRTNVWAMDSMSSLYCSPQIGVNCIFGPLDIGSTFAYRIGDGPEFNLMVGVSF